MQLFSANAKTEEFMFQNVAYRPTVYRTGVLTNDITAFKFQTVCYPVIG